MIESCLTTQSIIICRQLPLRCSCRHSMVDWVWVVRLGVTFVAPGEQLNPTRAVHVLELAPLINTDIVSYVQSLAEINSLYCALMLESTHVTLWFGCKSVEV